jgi:hypothetical protein
MRVQCYSTDLQCEVKCRMQMFAHGPWNVYLDWESEIYRCREIHSIHSHSLQHVVQSNCPLRDLLTDGRQSRGSTAGIFSHLLASPSGQRRKPHV